MALGKVAFILDEFSVGTAGQQLLDRFLIGYPRDGEFRAAPARQVTAFLATPSRSGLAVAPGLETRRRDHNLALAPGIADAVRGVDGVIVVSAEARPGLRQEMLENLVESVSPGVPCFVHGVFETQGCAERVSNLARRRAVPLACGSSLSTVQRLPDVPIDPAPLAESLIVVHGDRPAAEWCGIEGLLPNISGPSDGNIGLTKIVRLSGRSVWRAGDHGIWSWPLLRAALSRSNTTQGDPVRDGRTQDLAGKELVRKLARSPRGWVLEHRGGLRSSILVLNGVVADINLATRSRDGIIQSSQLYRPVGPGRCEFDRLSAAIEDFLTTSRAPWPVERSLIAAAFMERVPA